MAIIAIRVRSREYISPKAPVTRGLVTVPPLGAPGLASVSVISLFKVSCKFRAWASLHTQVPIVDSLPIQILSTNLPLHPPHLGRYPWPMTDRS